MVKFGKEKALTQGGASAPLGAGKEERRMIRKSGRQAGLAFDRVCSAPLTLIFSGYESFGFRWRWTRARSGVEAAAVAARVESVLRARERRHGG